MQTVEKTTCRICPGYCPVNVTMEDGTVVKVEGNPDAPIYEGFICPKGRALATTHSHTKRLLQHLKKQPDGSFTPISSEQLVDEISTKIGQILEESGPEGIAAFLGSPSVEHQALLPLMNGFLNAIGSPNLYSTGTIDQPGINIADAIHGTWAGGHPHPENQQAMVLVGTNPIISKQYFGQNPGNTIKRLVKNGLNLIVIDPRRTECARHARVFLQCTPGEDPSIMAGLIHLLIKNDRVNNAFVDKNASGFAELTSAVEPFTPDYVAERAGVNREDLLEAAQLLGEAQSGTVCTGVGPSMATRGTLTTYLCRCLQTIRGFWPGEGEKVYRPRVLYKEIPFKAQPNPPMPGWGFGKTMRVRGLQVTAAGMPCGALPGEILTPGKGQVRALFMHSGAAVTWPQAALAREALEAVEMLIVHDVEAELSETARLADYVIATTLEFEEPVISQFLEILCLLHYGYGHSEPYAAYSPALTSPPLGSDVMECWQIYYRVAQKLGLQLKCANVVDDPETAPLMDMNTEPTTDELFELMCQGSVVPLSEVKKYPDGNVFEQAKRTVGPRDANCTARFELANATMLEELDQVASESHIARRGTSESYPLLLISRRIQNTTNTSYRPEGLLKKPYNPAYMNSADLEAMNLVAGDKVKILSRHGSLVAFVDVDNNLKPGVVSLTHGFGRFHGADDYDPYRDGANINELTHWEDDYDRYNGIPRMGALPVAVTSVG